MSVGCGDAGERVLIMCGNAVLLLLPFHLSLPTDERMNERMKILFLLYFVQCDHSLK